jgi:choloylglycine hydrolase
MCTTLLITAKDGTVVSGRTMEFGFDVESDVMVIPTGTPMTGTVPGIMPFGTTMTGTPPNGAGISYTTTHDMIGANGLGFQVIVDGINDQGLYFSALYFPGYAEYAQVTPDNISHAMAPHELGNWVLGTCATLEEVRDTIGSIVLVNTVVEALGGPAPLHFIVRDPFGKSLVIEPLQGKLKLYDNPVGVMTNSPTFDWHLTNLRNYRGLVTENVGDVVLRDDFELRPFGLGGGMFGLPGDATPPSRFVRAVAYSQTAVPVETADDAVLQVFHIMNAFDIPVGSVSETLEEADPIDKDAVKKIVHNDYTIWTSVADLANCRWYFRTYNDQSIRKIDLKTALKAAKGKVRFIVMDAEDSKQPVVDTSTVFIQPIIPISS